MPPLAHTHVFERDEHVYLVAPVAPIELSDSDLEELAFAGALREQAPNGNILWLHGPFVEADKPNLNGALWTANELAIKSLTPRFMPVTIMHDPTTAVGLIADTKLLTREQNPELARARIDTTLGIWKHRFPQIAEEIAANYEQGTLMQSMECLPAYYDCTVCERRFPKLPGGAERANWCEHLRGETAAANGKPTRRLGNVTFTGTGLIFGTRGATGAYDDANLAVLEEEVAEFHERAAHQQPQRKPTRRPRGVMEIEDQKYQELVAKASKVDDLEAKVATLTETAGRIPELEKKVETEETAKKAAEKERDELKGKVEAAEETARAQTLAKDRIDKLGKGFTSKLGEFTRGRLDEQAGKLTDEEWDARLKELEETAEVKRDDKGDGTEDETAGGGNGSGNGSGTFSREETARAGGGAGSGSGAGGGGTPPSRTQVRSAVAGLVHPPKAT
jgi:hypothetical protein